MLVFFFIADWMVRNWYYFFRWYGTQWKRGTAPRSYILCAVWVTLLRDDFGKKSATWVEMVQGTHWEVGTHKLSSSLGLHTILRFIKWKSSRRHSWQFNILSWRNSQLQCFVDYWLLTHRDVLCGAVQAISISTSWKCRFLPLLLQFSIITSPSW